jgi:hypothetical protein
MNQKNQNRESGHQNQANQEYQQQLVAKIFQVELSQDLESKTLDADKPKSQEMQTESATSGSPIKTATQAALNVYTNNFIENGIRALSITFPTVEGFMGEDSFRMLSRRYLKCETKTSFDWAEYGCGLPVFITEQEALEEYPFLCEVAQLDWAIHKAQREPDQTFAAASFALLESGDTSLLRFLPAPGLQVLKFWFPVSDLYRLIHDPSLQSAQGALARQALLTEINISISSAINNSSPRSLILWRPEYKAQFEYLSEAEADVMQQLVEHASVDAIIESIGTHNIDLVAWLSKAISNKFIFCVA